MTKHIKNLRTSLLFIFVCFKISCVNAQNDIVIGKSYILKSKVLEEDRNIQISLPTSYHESKTNYPTVYILDGQMYFEMGVAMQKQALKSKLFPEMIVVGIDMKRPRRDDLIWDQRDQLIGFIEIELVSCMDSMFRTSQQRILFGWEGNGFVASEVLLSDEGLFDAAIASNGVEMYDKLLDSFQSQADKKDKYLYIANTDLDIYTIGSSEGANELLKKRNPENLIWKYDRFDEEIHESLAYISLYHGLKLYYHNYGILVFSGMKDFNRRGGMPYLSEYYAGRGKRFGFPEEIDNSTKNSLIWMAWKSDDFTSFKTFMTEFSDVLPTKRYASAYWQNRLAQFYLKHKDYANALIYFDRGIEKYSDDKKLAKMLYGRARTYLGLKNKRQATKDMKQAIEVEKINDGDRLDFYQQELNKMR